ncbi:MAG: hypothetical protein M3Z92_03670 [Bacteroidota bacterium]|nr:hypothetical protein [Bacteroidota bacterium]MDQ6902708.1 hypothetical protein [Bacteroidota bacterium]
MENNKKQNQTNAESLIDQTKANKDNQRYFNLVVDKIPYRVEFEPFFFNEQVRYYVSINAGPKDVFVWDTNVELFRAIDDNAGVLPVGLEKAISEKLKTQNLE